MSMHPSREWHLDLRYPDLHALGSLLRVCGMAVTPLTPAPMKAALGSDDIGDTILSSSHYEFPLRARFRVPDDRCLVGYMHAAGEGSWVGGEPLQTGMVMLGMPGSRCELRLAKDACWSLMLCDGKFVRNRFSSLDFYVQTVSRRVQRLRPEPGTEVAERMHGMFDCLRLRFVEQRRDINTRGLVERIQEHLIDDIVSLFPAVPDTSRTRHSHYLVLRRVENFIAANMRHEIRVRDLCEAGSTSERNLRYIFGDFIGISPNHYLSTLRLCEARRLLSEALPGQNTVRAIALECGLWDLSRFAESYRQLFDELPSETLRVEKTYISEERTPYLSPSIQFS